MRPNNGLFIPLEIIKREYTGKMLISALMASRGMPVFIGHKSSVINLAKKATQPGILFYKSAKGPGCIFFNDLKKKGFAIVAQDEEAGIVFSNFSEFYKNRKSLENAGLLTQFFCWGKDDFEYIKKHTRGDPGVIKLTGSLRTCLWGDYGRKYFLKEISDIKRKHGEFILFISNFASGNSYLFEKDIINFLSQYPGWDKKRHLEQTKFDWKMISLFTEAAKIISRQLKIRIIIRPHPAENKEIWVNLTKKISNVFVESTDDITPWIFSSKCIIQNGCTSAIEAVFANIPVIAFGRSEKDLYCQENSFPNRCAIPSIGIDDLLKSIKNIEKKWDNVFKEKKEMVTRKAYNAGTLKPVYDIADNLLSISGHPNLQGNKKLGRNKFLCDLIELYRMSPIRRKTRVAVMDQSKRPTISYLKIKKDLERSMSVLNISDKLMIKKVGVNSYKISKNT